MNHTAEGNTALSLLDYFKEISAIPRGSGNEAGIAKYLCEFAEARSLEYYRDEYDNVLIKKPAFRGYESKSAVMLQAHVDMVCEKLPELQHDFLNDPIELTVNGDILTANGTTLGADNGIGVAAMLSALASPSLPAPALECLFTTEEETGMRGALNFDYSKITSRKLVNLDNSDEGEACCGCAGGVNTTLRLEGEYVPRYGKKALISVEGLAGGHSGMDIDLGRQNAISLLGKALLSLYERSPFCLVTVAGGSKPNVIPSSAYAVATFFDTKAAKEADTYLRSYFLQAKTNFCRADKRMKYSFKNLSAEVEEAVIPRNSTFPDAQLSYKSTHKLLALIAAAPTGVLKYMPNDRSRVLSSVNQGVLTHDGDIFRLTFFARSCFDFEFENTVTVIKGLGRLYGAKATVSDPAPGWKYRLGCDLQAAYARVCSEVLGKAAVFNDVHAGLECGAIVSALNRIDGAERAEAISIGPDLRDIHSVKESVSISSCDRFYKILTELLKTSDR